eukprot:Phypoly_transcript_11686.p1 GENE.Phypoly_transcript_11686~~Phypoly_transcript_11686.p1  ORF type:complete len:252 (+),score=44.11 Phypoly_transcript_11686:37-756(+)
MSTMLLDSGDFAQVPFSQESLAPVQDDWMGQLQVLDLPQLFSFKDSSSDFSSEELDDFSKGVDLNTLESLLDVVPPTSQHEAPGPTRSTSTKQKESPIAQPTTPTTTPKGIAISRDELLRFTSDDLEAYVKTLSASRTLTAADLKEIKRQRRLIKNRESAQQSRKRKKDKVGDLEGQVAQLETVNEERKAKLEEIQAENVILKAEVSQLVNVIKDSPALSSLLMNVTSWVCDSSSSPLP